MLAGAGDFGSAGETPPLQPARCRRYLGVFSFVFIDHGRVSGPVAKSPTQAKAGVEWVTRDRPGLEENLRTMRDLSVRDGHWQGLV